MKIKPYKLKLKKVSGEAERLLSAVYSYLPSSGLEADFGGGIKEAVTRHVGEDFSIGLEAADRITYGSYLSKLPKMALLAVVGLAPLTKKAILEIDVPIAMVAIEKMLGGQPQSVLKPRELTDTEEGVLQYLLLEVLAFIHRTSGRDARVHIRFDRFAFDSREVRELGSAEENCALLTYRVTLGRFKGFVRLLLPDPFVSEGLMNVESAGELRPSERARRLEELARFGYIKTPMWAEAGRVTVSYDEFKSLEEGDVILFDKSFVTLANSEPHGNVMLRIGNGLSGGIEASLDVDAKSIHCRIERCEVEKGG